MRPTFWFVVSACFLAQACASQDDPKLQVGNITIISVVDSNTDAEWDSRPMEAAARFFRVNGFYVDVAHKLTAKDPARSSVLVTLREAPSPCSAVTQVPAIAEAIRSTSDPIVVIVGGTIRAPATFRKRLGFSCRDTAMACKASHEQVVVLMDRRSVTNYDASIIAAHELGHAFGLNHINAAEPCGFDAPVETGAEADTNVMSGAIDIGENFYPERDLVDLTLSAGQTEFLSQFLEPIDNGTSAVKALP